MIAFFLNRILWDGDYRELSIQIEGHRTIGKCSIQKLGDLATFNKKKNTPHKNKFFARITNLYRKSFEVYSIR